MLQPYGKRVSAPVHKQLTKWVGAAADIPSAPVLLFLLTTAVATLDLPLLQALRHSASMWQFALNDPLSLEIHGDTNATALHSRPCKWAILLQRWCHHH